MTLQEAIAYASRDGGIIEIEDADDCMTALVAEVERLRRIPAEFQVVRSGYIDTGAPTVTTSAYCPECVKLRAELMACQQLALSQGICNAEMFRL